MFWLNNAQLLVSQNTNLVCLPGLCDLIHTAHHFAHPSTHTHTHLHACLSLHVPPYPPYSCYVELYVVMFVNTPELGHLLRPLLRLCLLQLRVARSKVHTDLCAGVARVVSYCNQHSCLKAEAGAVALQGVAVQPMHIRLADIQTQVHKHTRVHTDTHILYTPCHPSLQPSAQSF